MNTHCVVGCSGRVLQPQDVHLEWRWKLEDPPGRPLPYHIILIHDLVALGTPGLTQRFAEEALEISWRGLVGVILVVHVTQNNI